MKQLTAQAGRIAATLRRTPPTLYLEAAGVGLATAMSIVIAYLVGALMLFWVTGWQLPGGHFRDSSGLLGIVTTPVRHYLAHATAGLPVTAAGTYEAWRLIGAGAFLLGWLWRSTGARVIWLAWTAATVAMVWDASPAGSRSLAAGLTLFALLAASVPVLRYVSLRPIVHADVDVHAEVPLPELHADIHVPATPRTYKPYDPGQHQGGPSLN
jgi:hypothetical protein